MNLKRYIWDQSILLLFGLIIAVAFCIFAKNNFILKVILVILTALSWGYLCKSLILLPLDLVAGKKTQEVYFSKYCIWDKYEFFRNTYNCIWTFHDPHHKKFDLLVPFSKSKDEILLAERPETDRKIRVTYYKFSKIMLSWEYV